MLSPRALHHPSQVGNTIDFVSDKVEDKVGGLLSVQDQGRRPAHGGADDTPKSDKGSGAELPAARGSASSSNSASAAKDGHEQEQE